MGIKSFVEKYNSEFIRAVDHIEITDDAGILLEHHTGIELSVKMLLDIQTKNHRIYIVGNGGSAAIASHAAIDFLKNGNIPASFSNSAILTALKGTDSDGFKIMVFPRAIALGMVQLGTMLGKLNGTMQATTPTG